MEKIEVPSYLKFTNRDIKELLVKNVGVFRCFPRTDLVIMNAIFTTAVYFPSNIDMSRGQCVIYGILDRNARILIK